jgi:uncharacterized protein (TIGR02147 family)
MPSVYDYLDFRLYLRDYYAEQKAKNPHFSYELFTRLAGFKAKSLIHNILSGKRNVSKDGIFQIGAALKLNRKELAFSQDPLAPLRQAVRVLAGEPGPQAAAGQL